MRALINTEKKLIKEKNLDSDLPVFRLLCLLGEFSGENFLCSFVTVWKFLTNCRSELFLQTVEFKFNLVIQWLLNFDIVIG